MHTAFRIITIVSLSWMSACINVNSFVDSFLGLESSERERVLSKLLAPQDEQRRPQAAALWCNATRGVKVSASSMLHDETDGTDPVFLETRDRMRDSLRKNSGEQSVLSPDSGVLSPGAADGIARDQRMKCTCEQFECDCNKQCSCKLNADDPTKPPKTVHLSAGPGNAQLLDYTFRCDCGFSVDESSKEFDTLACDCGANACKCRRKCICTPAAA